MAVSLPISTAVNIPAARPAVSSPVFAATAPSVGLPMSFMTAGLLSLCSAVAWLVASPDLLTTYHYNQNVIAVTHLFVLGWISSVVMGATYQLVPVALETKLYSERLARVQFVLHTVGFVGMVWMFHRWNLKQVGHFGSALGVGVAFFVYNIVQTLRRVPKWTVTATAVAASLGWISCAVLAGLTIAGAKSVIGSEAALTSGPVLHGLQSIATWVGRFDPISTMHAHAHLGAVGCFTMLIIGVSYKVIPMFTLSEVQNRRRAAASVILLNLGLVGTFFGILLRWPAKVAFTCLIAAALVLYLWELIAILRHRKRRTLDWGIKSFLTAIALLLPLSVLAMVLSWPGLPLTATTGQLENLYGFIGFIGVISFAIVGMLYKILPFLVWFKSYSRHVGRSQVPALGEMYSERWQAFGYWSYLAGLIATSVGIVSVSNLFTRLGCAALAVSLLTVLINAGSMLTHLLQPQLKPFPAPRVSAAKPV